MKKRDDSRHANGTQWMSWWRIASKQRNNSAMSQIVGWGILIIWLGRVLVKKTYDLMAWRAVEPVHCSAFGSFPFLWVSGCARDHCWCVMFNDYCSSARLDFSAVCLNRAKTWYVHINLHFTAAHLERSILCISVDWLFFHRNHKIMGKNRSIYTAVHCQEWRLSTRRRASNTEQYDGS